jgi:hypothetical protein
MPKHDLFARSTGLLRIEARGEPPPAEKPDSASAGLHEETCPPNNVIAFDNAIEVIETGGLRIAVWGDNRATLVAKPRVQRPHQGYPLITMESEYRQGVTSTGRILSSVVPDP